MSSMCGADMMVLSGIACVFHVWSRHGGVVGYGQCFICVEQTMIALSVIASVLHVWSRPDGVVRCCQFFVCVEQTLQCCQVWPVFYIC